MQSDEHVEPARRVASVALAVICILVLVVALALVGFARESVPAWALLLAIPLALGALGAVVVDPRGERSPLGCALYPAGGLILLTAFAWLVLGEGAICIAMVLPLWIPVAIGGALANRWLHRQTQRRRDRDIDRFRMAAWTLLPAFILALEVVAPPQWEMREVTRTTLVNAEPAEVWPLVLAIPEIGGGEGRWNPTQDLLGVPRPSDARLVRREGALVREARWGSDVRFEERITAIDHERSLAWRFAFPDASVQRHTDNHIAPDGENLKIVSGRYTLSYAGNGQTRVALVTRYALRTRMSGYFAWWGERMLGDIQANVLAIIAQRADARW